MTFEDTPDKANARHDDFLRDVVANRVGWGLKSKAGWVNWQSEDDPESNIAPFWSNRDDARKCAEATFPGYHPESVDLDELLTVFLPFLAEQDAWVGANPTPNMTGIDVPAEGLMELLTERISESSSPQ